MSTAVNKPGEIQKKKYQTREGEGSQRLFVIFPTIHPFWRWQSSLKLKGRTATFKVGDHVIFGRTNGRKRPGVIVKTNPARAVIKDTNLGGTWRVPYSLMEAA